MVVKAVVLQAIINSLVHVRVRWLAGIRWYVAKVGVQTRLGPKLTRVFD